MEVEMEMEAEEAAGAGQRKWKRDGAEVEVEEEEEEEVYEGIAEESVEELMRWLEMEISAAPAPKHDDDPADSSAAPGFVTINGNEESCGPSFSAAASTVMASVDTRAGAPPPPTVPWPVPPSSFSAAAAAAAGDADDEDDVAEFELDDDAEWLVELLTSGPPATEERTVATA